VERHHTNGHVAASGRHMNNLPTWRDRRQARCPSAHGTCPVSERGLFRAGLSAATSRPLGTIRYTRGRQAHARRPLVHHHSDDRRASSAAASPRNTDE
jgi:hypothetical protein